MGKSVFQPPSDKEIRRNDMNPSVDSMSAKANSLPGLHISSPLLRACEALGYSRPAPIQAVCINQAIGCRDIFGTGITGPGKTVAFALPTLERLMYRPKSMPAVRALILTPTTERAVQIHSTIGKLTQFITDIRCCLLVDGISTKEQETALRALPDIVVATPGPIIDHLHNTKSVHLDELGILILDEADRLLELGFSAEVQDLVKICPKSRQTMLFSATMTEKVEELVKLSLNNPTRLAAARPISKTVLRLDWKRH